MPVSGGELDMPEMSLHELLWSKLLEHGDRAALVDVTNECFSLTYKDIYDYSRICAAYLQLQGVKKGDVVAIYSVGVFENLFLMIGILGAGATVVPIPLWLKDEKILQQFATARPKIVFVDGTFIDKMKAFKLKTPSLKRIFVIGMESKEFVTLKQILTWKKTEILRKVEIDPVHDVALLSPLIGKAGQCCIKTHQNYVAMAATRLSIENLEPEKEQRTVYCVSHYDNPNGFSNVLACLISGVKIFHEQLFNLQSMFRCIEKHQIPYVICHNSMIDEMLEVTSTEEYDLSSLNKIFTNGMSLSVDVVDKIIKRYNVMIQIEYGLIECPILSVALAKCEGLTVIPGKVQRGVEVKITNVDTEEECPVGSSGEVRVRCLQAIKGYLDNPAETTAIFDHDGWMKTGEIGLIDEDGYLIFNP